MGKEMFYLLKWWVVLSSEIIQLKVLVKNSGEPAVNSDAISVTDDGELWQVWSATVDVSYASGSARRMKKSKKVKTCL